MLMINIFRMLKKKNSI